jgi:hypothetical protein
MTVMTPDGSASPTSRDPVDAETVRRERRGTASFLVRQGPSRSRRVLRSTGWMPTGQPTPRIERRTVCACERGDSRAKRAERSLDAPARAFECGLRSVQHLLRCAALGRARDQAEVAGKGHHGEYRPERPREDLHALAIHDLALVGRSARRHRPHLGDRERVSEGSPELCHMPDRQSGGRQGSGLALICAERTRETRRFQSSSAPRVLLSPRSEQRELEQRRTVVRRVERRRAG